MSVKDAVIEDLLALQSLQGANLIYIVDQTNTLVGIQLNNEGDEVARFRVAVQLEKL